jgi:hypothetical protein
LPRGLTRPRTSTARPLSWQRTSRRIHAPKTTRLSRRVAAADRRMVLILRLPGKGPVRVIGEADPASAASKRS